MTALQRRPKRQGDSDWRPLDCAPAGDVDLPGRRGARARPAFARSAAWLVAALLSVLIAGSVHAHAHGGSPPEPRNVRFNHLTVNHGLSHAAVTAIAQDHRGFMWIGTQDGLNRYDGQQVVTFLRDSNDPGQLPHNWIWTLHADSRGNLWVGTVPTIGRGTP